MQYFHMGLPIQFVAIIGAIIGISVAIMCNFRINLHGANSSHITSKIYKNSRTGKNVMLYTNVVECQKDDKHP